MTPLFAIQIIMVSTAVYLPVGIGCVEGDLHPNETAKIAECGWT